MNFPAKRNLPLLVLAVSLSLGTSGCLFFGHKAKSPLVGAHAAPDKVLYNRAMHDIQHHNYTVARLALQTLINTYPNSEYLAKAKLAIADSFYSQGGTNGLTQAVAQYKDFITFFPFLDEAAFAQYRVAMSHFRMMEKPDRDSTQALDAEAEFQTMILKYPKSRWTKQAKQRLREVQEVLAEGEFEVASFYDIRRAYAAAAARLLDLTERYPLFSEADQANFMLAQIYEKDKHKAFAARFYSKIVREYPLSSLAPEAKKRLVALGYPVPRPDPRAVARMKDEEKYVRQRPGILRQALGILRTGPDVSRAAHYGEPDMTPETQVISARQVLEPSVVSMAANAAPGHVSAVSVSNVPSASDLGDSSLPSPGGSEDNVVAGSTGSSTPAASIGGQASSKDPSKGPQGQKKKAVKNGRVAGKKNKKKKNKDKKKKGFFHKMVPW